MQTEPTYRLCLPHTSTPADAIVAWQGETPILNQQLQRRIAAWHALLQKTDGQRFALYLEDSFEFACALYGGWLAGKTLYLPSNILRATCASLQNQVHGFLGDFPENLKPQLPDPNRLETRDTITDASLPDYIGLVIYTSGTTGAAQAISKRLSQLAAEIACLEKVFGKMVGPAATEFVATVSHEHIYGLLFKLLWPLSTSRIIHLRSAVVPAELLPLLSSRACVLVSGPAHLKRLPDIFTAPHQLRAVFSSGAALTEEAAERVAQRLGKIPIEIYGSSETGGVAWRQAPATAWRALPGVSWRISKQDGLLEVRSPHLAGADWFCTEDRAKCVNKDYFVLEGRADNIVKLEGKRISLSAIERSLQSSPLVRTARVLMIDVAQERQRIVAFIVLNATGHATLAQIGKVAFKQGLRELLVGQIDPIAMPRSWRYLHTLPLNANGKTTRAELLALLETAAAPCTLPLQILVERFENEVQLELTIVPDLIYFDGHFAAAPILPGVVQLDWAIFFGRQYFNLPPVFCSVHALKFQNIIGPNMKVMLLLQYDAQKAQLTFSLHSPAGRHASGRILFSEFKAEAMAER